MRADDEQRTFGRSEASDEIAVHRAVHVDALDFRRCARGSHLGQHVFARRVEHGEVLDTARVVGDGERLHVPLQSRDVDDDLAGLDRIHARLGDARGDAAQDQCDQQ
jgi:hypothetical protein